MPELPEVETMCRGIHPIQGCHIDRILVPRSRYQPIAMEPGLPSLRRRLTGKAVTAIERKGKRPILKFEDEQRLVFEPRMTGLLTLAVPPTSDHVRLQISFAEAEQGLLTFWDRRGLGTVTLLSEQEFDQRLGPGKLGEDALRISPDLLRARLGKSRRQIKVALLDQQAVAGIGNIYASEILFEAAIDPRTHCDRLSGRQWERIARFTKQVLERAIRFEGSTLADGTYRNALNQSGSYQNHHRVYDRADQACRRCGDGSIERIVQAQRATYFCKSCQRKRDPKPA